MSNPLEESAEELAAAVRALRESVQQAHDVRNELARLMQQGRVNRGLSVVVSAGLAVTLVLITVMIIFGLQHQRNTARIDRIVKVQQDSAICPLYKIFIDADTPANRERARQQGQDLAVRDQQFVIIRRSYNALNCSVK